MDVSFTLVANHVKCNVNFFSGWMKTVQVEPDSIKPHEKDSTEEKQALVGVLVPEAEEEAVAVEAQMNRHQLAKEEQENAEIVVKRV